jgi:hypothetical protein
LQVNGLPGQRTRLGDPQATAQHEEEKEAIPEGGCFKPVVALSS